LPSEHNARNDRRHDANGLNNSGARTDERRKRLLLGKVLLSEFSERHNLSI